MDFDREGQERSDGGRCDWADEREAIGRAVPADSEDPQGPAFPV